MFGICLVVFKQQLASFLIQGRIWKWLYEKAANHDKDMPKAKVWFPIAFENVDTDLSRLGDVRMENLCEEKSCTFQLQVSALHPLNARCHGLL